MAGEMMAKFVGRALIVAALFVASIAHAQELPKGAAATEDVDEEVSTVIINGVKGASRMHYKSMLKAVATFEENHQLAPAADLKFSVCSNPALPAPIALQVETGDDKLMPIKVDADCRFTLPKAEVVGSTKGDLISNRKKFSINPYVRTPGLADDVNRLGDLRLACEVTWTLLKESDEGSFLTRMAIKTAVSLAGGLCHASNFGFGVTEKKKLRSVELVSGDRHLPLGIRKGKNNYSPPLYDKTWPDDALVKLTYEDEPAAPALVPTPTPTPTINP